MTINENPSGLPEQEPTSTTAVVLLNGEAWLRTGIDRWESLFDANGWASLRVEAAERGGATLFDLADLPTGLTEAQKEAVRSIESKFFTRGGISTKIRDAFPEAFGDLVTATWDPCDPDASPSELLRVAEMEGAHVTATRYGATRSGNVHHVERSVRIHLGAISDEVVIDLLLGGWTITATAPKPADPTGGGREEIDQLKARISDLAAKPEPGPWLRGDELKAVVPTLRAGDVVEVDCMGHTATGELWAHSPSGLSLWSSLVRTSDGNTGPYVDALRIIERATEPEPEPGADIPDEVVAAAGEKIMELADKFIHVEVLRAAFAAADAKRAELEG